MNSISADLRVNGQDVEKSKEKPDAVEAIQQHDNTDSADSINELERWNSPRINSYRFYATNLSFLIMGMNDASLGALLPYIETYYDINYTTVSTMFLVPVAGYVLAALTNNWIHYTLGQRGDVKEAWSCMKDKVKSISR